MSDKKLTLEELDYVQKEVATHTKSLPAAYLFAIFLGFLGIHRAYFGKKKTAVVKSLITIFGGITLGLIIKNMATLDLSSELTMEILTANAALAVPFIALFSIGLGWYLVDLFLIPRWKKNWDEKTKEKATVDVVQGRHVSTQLLREQLSEELVQNAKAQAVNKIEEIILKLDSEELHQLSQPSIPNLPELTAEEIREEIARLEAEIEKYELAKKAKEAEEAEEARLAEEKLKEEQEKQAEDESLKGELETAEQTPDDNVSDESITEEKEEELAIEKQNDNVDGNK